MPIQTFLLRLRVFLSLLFSKNVHTSARERDSHACAFSPYVLSQNVRPIDRPLPSDHNICRLRVEACGNRRVRVFVCAPAPQYTMAIMSLICTHLYYKYIIDWHNIKTFSYLTRLPQTFGGKFPSRLTAGCLRECANKGDTMTRISTGSRTETKSECTYGGGQDRK